LQIYYDHIIPFYNKKDGYPHQVLRQIAIAKCILLIALKYFHFRRVIKQMRQRAPNRISKKRLERFIQKKSQAIDTLIATDTQNARLHVLKKQLKDVLYSLKIFHPPVQNHFPIAGKMSLYELNKLSDILNDYLDWVVGITLLNAALLTRLSVHDKDILKGIRK
jgi:CHAD domain-containing protein